VAEPGDESAWEPARLIPISGINGADEQERRGTSALLAVLVSVKEFGRALTTQFGAPAGAVETFIEVPFTVGDAKVRPDGLIRVRRGSKTWVALVEVKTGRGSLRADQVEAYLDVARDNGFDAVLTISNEMETAPGVHPLCVDRRKLKRVSLFHLSWSQIHTEAVIQRVNQSVSDPDQAWILAEFVRYLQSTKSGAVDLEDMGPAWVPVREAAVTHSLRSTDPNARAVAERFEQLLSYAGMRLSRQLGIEVRPALSRKELADPQTRLASQVTGLAETGRLSGSLLIPNAIAPVTLTVDLRAGRSECSVLVDAPDTARQQTKVNWLMRQLGDAPADLRIEAVVSRARQPGPNHTVAELLADPKKLGIDPAADLRSFRLTVSRSSGSKRGQGRGSFIGSVTALVDNFYADVVQTLKPWTPQAPQVKAPTRQGTGPGTSTPLAQVEEHPEPQHEIADHAVPTPPLPVPVVHDAGRIDREPEAPAATMTQAWKRTQSGALEPVARPARLEPPTV
jgi:hypothetical protein